MWWGSVQGTTSIVAGSRAPPTWSRGTSPQSPTATGASSAVERRTVVVVASAVVVVAVVTAPGEPGDADHEQGRARDGSSTHGQ